MDVEQVRGLVNEVVPADVGGFRAELAAVRVVRGLLDACEVLLTRGLQELAAVDPGVFPEEVVASAAMSSLSRGVRATERAKTCAAVPELGAALAAGETTGDRIDLVTRAVAGLNAADKAKLAAHGERLAAAAGSQTDGEFRRTVDRLVRVVRSDDGLDRLAQQRRMVRLRSWTDMDGMWCLSGRFDPASGARLEGRLRNTIEGLFHDRIPETCPTDAVDKQQHLAGLALLAIFDGTAASGGAPDVTVVIDYDTFTTGTHEGSLLRVGWTQAGLPVDTIRRWACMGDVTPVVVAPDGVRLALGRSTRLANRAQRRALRVWYQGCALCDTAFELCQIHHITPFATGGATDVDNLLPLCNQHHHLVHEGGWILHLAPDRTLTITKPGGHITTHPPPQARAA